jgi:ferritin-like protein
MLQLIKRRQSSRRSFLRGGLAAPGVIGLAMLGDPLPTAAFDDDGTTHGDIAILRFLSALEILETDLWQQYNELGGIQDNEVPGGTGNKPYTDQLAKLDSDMAQYIHDNTEDEMTHFTFINAYLKSKRAQPVDLEKFRTLPGSTAPGSSGKKRLTNLMELTVDTSWWTRYRSRTKNPDLGDTFPQAIPSLAGGKFPAIPRNASDQTPDAHIQAIAQTAAFHFATIEQGGSSLYPSLAQRVSSVEVLRILLSIGPTETMHFQTWSDKATNFSKVTDPVTGLVFPDPATFDGNEDLQTNLIMPEPTFFLSRNFPVCSIIRPTETRNAATNAFAGLKASGLFTNQSDAFFATMNDLAARADMAQRRHD